LSGSSKKEYESRLVSGSSRKVTNRPADGRFPQSSGCRAQECDLRSEYAKLSQYWDATFPEGHFTALHSPSEACPVGDFVEDFNHESSFLALFDATFIVEVYEAFDAQ
jgi:hypothetical protein